MSILVPPRVAAGLAIQNVRNAILQHIASEPDPDAPGRTRDRVEKLTTADLKTAFERLEVAPPERNRIMNELLRERIIRTDGTRVWIADAAFLRGWLEKNARAA